MVKSSISGFFRSGVKVRKELRVQVFQGPALQCEYRTFLDKIGRVRIGKSGRAELPLPYSLFASDILIFAITKWGARVYLDPRFSGFISDGQRFGEVRDFIAPRGALKELGSILEPLEVPIPVGSRGTLEIGGYTVVFRVDRHILLQPRPVVVGAPKAPFALPIANSAVEKSGFLLGCFLSILVSVPAVYWLNKAPIKEFRSLNDLPPLWASELIHPDHFQILPWVYGQEFDVSKIVSQSVTWVDELRRKWGAEDAGENYVSSLSVLRGFSAPENVFERQKSFREDLEAQWQEIISKRDAASPGSFLKGQKAYAPMKVTVSGGERGSISERVRARHEKLERTRRAIISLIETEHAFMKEHFSSMNAEINQIFDPPKEPGLFFRLAEEAFSQERNNYHAAESFAALGRERRKKGIDRINQNSQKFKLEDPFVWSERSLTIPHTLNFSVSPNFAGSEADLVRNAKLSTGVLAPPPAPRPVPKIDMDEVETYVRGRSAEVKACYDTALGRNPQIGGSIVWRWIIDENGRVRRSRVSSTTIKDNLFVRCLDQKIKAWVFPRPQNGPVAISFPFRFVVRENMQTLDQFAK